YLEQVHGIKPEASPVVLPLPNPDLVLPRAPEPTEFCVILEGYESPQKIGLIRVLRELLGLGIKEARDSLDNLPKPVRGGLAKDEAEKLKTQLSAAGGQVVIKAD